MYKYFVLMHLINHNILYAEKTNRKLRVVGVT